MSALHVILGSGGAIGTPLARELVAQGERIRTVSRSAKGEPGCEQVHADLTDKDQTEAAVEDGSIVYLLVGLSYDSRVWRLAWPRIMTNVIAACKARRARLLFLDNVYAYGAVNGSMTEDTPMQPSSEKGLIRAEIAGRLLSEMHAGTITALIARAADFYGPHASDSSIPYTTAFQPLLAGKTQRWLVSATTRHSYSYTLDCAKALALLARADDAFGQVWHLPTAHPPLTGEKIMEIAARTLRRPLRYRVLPKLFIGLAGLFNRQVLEVYRMIYQNDRDYVFDSSKFEKHFRFTPTPYEKGIAETLSFFRAASNP
jgi:nucleoside-diphosphate-sugar epimerase